MNKYGLDNFKRYDFTHKILIISTLLVIITYSSGPFLPDFFLTIASLIFLVISTKKKIKKILFQFIYNFFFTFFYIYNYKFFVCD